MYGITRPYIKKAEAGPQRGPMAFRPGDRGFSDVVAGSRVARNKHLLLTCLWRGLSGKSLVVHNLRSVARN